MMNPCIDCNQKFEGLWWFIPDEAWLSIADTLDAGELCPWCANKRLSEKGIFANAIVSLGLTHFQGSNWKVMEEFEKLDGRIAEARRTRDIARK